MEPGQSLAEWRDRLDGYEARAFPLRGGARLDAGILKGFVDGVIEARTASMLAPYEGDTSSGLPAWEPDVLDAFVAEADRRGWQVELHAIGDRGVRLALDAFEHAARVNGPWAGDPHGRGAPGTHARRHRVEHIETIDPADIARFAALGVVASMQPYHGDPSPNQITVWAGNIGPERASRAWAWTSIRRAGGTPRVRLGLAGGAVRPVHRAQQRGQPPDHGRRACRRLAAGRAAATRRRAGGVHGGLRIRRLRRAPAGARARQGWTRTSSSSTATCWPPVHLRSSARTCALTVLGGRIVHRSEG